MTDQAAVADKVEKIMSIKPSEFEMGLARLDPGAPATNSNGTYQIPNSGGVEITFEKMEPAVLGGLIRMPRARVTLNLLALDAASRQTFLALFDQTFQRGGG